MFSVLFEVHPKSEQWDAYLHYKALTREDWILSLSNWKDENSVVRWRTKMRHHEAQERGRGEVLSDYHLRVGQITLDTRIPEGYMLEEQRLDKTEMGEQTTVMLIDAKRPSDWQPTNNPADCAEWLGLSPFTGFLSWDIFDAVLRPGDLILSSPGMTMRWPRIVMVPPNCQKARVYAACGSSATTVCMIDARRLSIIRRRRTV
jgi:hypothetical protein